MEGLGLFTRNAHISSGCRGCDACEHDHYVPPTSAVNDLIAVRRRILDPTFVAAAVRWQLRVAVWAHEAKVARSIVFSVAVDVIEDHGDEFPVPIWTSRVQRATLVVAASC